MTTHERPEPSPADGRVPGPADPSRVPGAGPAGKPSLGWPELLVGLAAYVLLSVGAYMVTGPPAPDGTNADVVLWSATIVTMLAVFAALLVRRRDRWTLGMRPTTWRWILAGIGVGLGMRVVAVVVVVGYVALTGDLSNPQDYLTSAVADGSTSDLIPLVMFGAVFVPFFEEALFRGVCYGALRRYGVVVALVVSTVLFAVAHGLNVVTVVAGLLGAANALLYERSGSLHPAIAAHVVTNALGIGAVALVMSA